MGIDESTVLGLAKEVGTYTGKIEGMQQQIDDIKSDVDDVKQAQIEQVRLSSETNTLVKSIHSELQHVNQRQDRSESDIRQIKATDAAVEPAKQDDWFAAMGKDVLREVIKVVFIAALLGGLWSFMRSEENPEEGVKEKAKNEVAPTKP